MHGYRQVMPRTLDDVTWPVRTERLTLRRAAAADIDAIWRYRHLEPVSRYLTSLPGGLEDFRAGFGASAKLASTLVVERDGVVVGDVMVRIQDAWSQSEITDQAAGTQAELGWVLAPEHHGQGYGTETVRALLQLCFSDLGLRRVEASCFAANEPSWRLMERVGMRREIHSIAESLHRSGVWMDGYGYAMLAQEWRARHA